MRIKRKQIWRIAGAIIALWFLITIIRLSFLTARDPLQMASYEIASNGGSNCDNLPPGSNSSFHNIIDWLPGDSLNKRIRQWSEMQVELFEWREEVAIYCSGNVDMLAKAGFGRLRRVIFDPNQAFGKLGGENVSQVLNQPESAEYWKFRPGAFLVLCPNSIMGRSLARIVGPMRRSKTHYFLEQYLAGSQAVSRKQFFEDSARATSALGPVLAVTRTEYANLYHTISHLYNAFTNAIFFGINPKEATILLMDGHPRGALDTIWFTLFGRVIRVGQLTQPAVLRDVVWVAEGHDSPVLMDRPVLPLVKQFRQFFLIKYGISHELKPPRSCLGSRIVIILRKDYLVHPRNPQGRVARKIANEKEVVMEVQQVIPHLKLNVTAIAMESLSFREQLELISGARLLIGMHGAGLTHAMFLPENSGLIELFPDRWTKRNPHFRSIATWRGLKYQSWVSLTGDNLQPLSIPKGVMADLVKRIMHSLRCI